MNQNFSVDQIRSATVYDNDGDKVGKVEQLYLDDQTNQPSWVTVNTGFFGTHESFVPLEGARFEGDELRVPHDKHKIKDAPHFDPGHHLEPADEEKLYDYYGIGSGTQAAHTGNAGQDHTHGQAGTAAAAGTAGAAGAAGTAAAAGHDRTAAGDDGRHVEGTRTGDAARAAETRTGDAARAAETGRTGDAAHATGEESMVRREEQLRVGTESQTAGRVRLRKHVVTETQNVEVPVQREELHIQREPLSDEEARAGGKLGDDEQVVTLREERPVVEKEVVGKEKVTLGKETVTDTETVSEQVRKEQVEVDSEGRTGREGHNPTDRKL